MDNQEVGITETKPDDRADWLPSDYVRLRLARTVKRRRKEPRYNHALRPKSNGLGLRTRASYHPARLATGTRRAGSEPSRCTCPTVARYRHHDSRCGRVRFSLPAVPQNTNQGTWPQETLNSPYRILVRHPQVVPRRTPIASSARLQSSLSPEFKLDRPRIPDLFVSIG